jgi:hypothetical protein
MLTSGGGGGAGGGSGNSCDRLPCVNGVCVVNFAGLPTCVCHLGYTGIYISLRSPLDQDTGTDLQFLFRILWFSMHVLKLSQLHAMKSTGQSAV